MSKPLIRATSLKIQRQQNENITMLCTSLSMLLSSVGSLMLVLLGLMFTGRGHPATGLPFTLGGLGWAIVIIVLVIKKRRKVLSTRRS